jgi:hypothetical protein
MLFGTALAIVQDPLPRYYRRCSIKFRRMYRSEQYLRLTDSTLQGQSSKWKVQG